MQDLLAQPTRYSLPSSPTSHWVFFFFFLGGGRNQLQHSRDEAQTGNKGKPPDKTRPRQDKTESRQRKRQTNKIPSQSHKLCYLSPAKSYSSQPTLRLFGQPISRRDSADKVPEVVGAVASARDPEDPSRH